MRRRLASNPLATVLMQARVANGTRTRDPQIHNLVL